VHWAATVETECLRVISAWKGDLNAEDIDQALPSHYAARSGSLSSLCFLANAGADVTSPDTAGRTPLHECALATCHVAALECARVLVAHGADVCARDEAGVTPAEAMFKAGRVEAAAFCVAYGAKRPATDSLFTRSVLLHLRQRLDALALDAHDGPAACMRAAATELVLRRTAHARAGDETMRALSNRGSPAGTYAAAVCVAALVRAKDALQDSQDVLNATRKSYDAEVQHVMRILEGFAPFDTTHAAGHCP